MAKAKAIGSTSEARRVLAGVLEGSWVDKLTARDWKNIRRAAEECESERAAEGSYDPQTIVTSAGYVEVHPDAVTAYGRTIPRRGWK